MIRDPNLPTPEHDAEEPMVPRVFLREPGWRVGLKIGSEREFCHSMAPGDDAYHRLADGEVFLYSPEERLCLPCADRRGLLHYEPKGLRQPMRTFELDGPALPGETFKVIERRTESESGSDES